MKSIIVLCAVILTMIAAPGFAETHSNLADVGERLANDTADLATKTANLVKDSAITGYIYAQIALEKNISKLKIDVSTDKGKVTLEGTVNADIEASTVIQIASSAPGVIAVDASRLKILKSSQPFTDLAITAEIKGAFIREKIFDHATMPMDVAVETKNGIVYLSGRASSQAQVDKVIKISQTVSGVKRVVSSVKVVNFSS